MFWNFMSVLLLEIRWIVNARRRQLTITKQRLHNEYPSIVTEKCHKALLNSKWNVSSYNSKWDNGFSVSLIVSMPLISSSRFIVLCQTIGIPSLSPLARVFGVDDSLARSRSAQIHANEETGTDQLYESWIRPLTGEMSPEFPITVSGFYKSTHEFCCQIFTTCISMMGVDFALISTQ